MVPLIQAPDGRAAAPSAAVRQVRSIEADRLGISHPAGLAFSVAANRFLVVPFPPTADGRNPSAEMVSISPREKRTGAGSVAADIANPLNFTFDNKNNSVLMLQFPENRLIEIGMTAEGDPDPRTLTSYDVQYLGLQDPQGLSVDPASGDLLVFDRAAHRIIRVAPAPGARFAGGRVTSIALQGVDLPGLRGVAFDPRTTHFYLLSPALRTLYEFAQSGAILAERNLSKFNLRDPRGLCFAPSGDLTDDPQKLSLYIADSGRTAATDGHDSRPARGSIVELSLTQPLTLAAAETTTPVALVRTIDTSQFSPPSPDPAGICYIDDTDTLLVSDSEVNEMSIFTGDNLFEMSRDGVLLATLSTLSLTTEPTGVAYNPLNRHLYFSDDNEARIIEIDPGPDGAYATADDIVSIVDSGRFDNYDPEGITFDTWRGVLFIADGVNSEVYRIDPGANGLFDGIPPDGDDQVTRFDTERLGVVDPEGIAFDSDNGLLYIIGEPAYLLAHITADGQLARMIDISAAQPFESAGLAYAPGSNNPDALNIYLTDRGWDNNVDPLENDGKIYELSLPPYTNAPPFVALPIAQIVVLPDRAQLDSRVFDDGLPNPPGALSVTWTLADGPAAVTFADAGSSETTASFAAPGLYLLRLNVTDGELTASAETTVLVVESMLAATADASVSIHDADSNLGSAHVLEAESLSDGSRQKLAYLRFEVTSLNGPAAAAYVGLKVSDPSQFGGSIHLVTDHSWEEGTITYNNKPEYDSQALDRFAAIGTGDVVLFDVSQAVGGNGTYDFTVLGGEPWSGSCAGGNDGAMGDSSDPGYNAANAAGEKIYFSQFSPIEDGIVSFLHYEEFSTAAAIRAGIYDAGGGLLSSCDEQSGTNSNPSVEMHCALEPPVCLESGQNYHLGVWVGKDGWAGTAYGGPGSGTYYNSDVTALPSSLNLPGERESGSTSIRITANNSANSFYPGITTGDVAGFFSRENPESQPTLNIYTVDANPFVANDDPDAATTPENTPVTTSNVLLNDQLTETAVINSFDPVSVNGGSVADNGDGTFLYTPALYYNGSDSFTYALSDDDGQTSTATVTVNVLPENSGLPVAVDDPEAASTSEDTPTTTSNVLLNDQLVDNATISGFSVTSATGGTLAYNGDGTFDYVPALNFSGSDSFTYTLSDDDNETSTATVTVDVIPVNDAPVADAMSIETAEDTVISGTLGAGDVDGDSLSYRLDAAASNGTANVNADGTYSYTPASSYTGEDSFSFVVNDGSVDSAPATVSILVMPLTGGTCEDGSGGIIGDSFDLGVNASNPQGETVYFSSFTPVQAGSVSYLHYEEYSTAAGVRAALYDTQGIMLAACVEQAGNNSNPSVEMHCALPQPVCLKSGQTYYLGVWVGDDRWAGSAYGGAGTGTFYNRKVSSLPSVLQLPGRRESGTTSLRMTANNSPDTF
jgi:hypothetical protein